jgi:hypothetical protein
VVTETMETVPGEDLQAALLRTLAEVARVLRAAGVPFAVTGGCAVYARGGPATSHDVDVLVLERDVTPAVRALVASGMRAADTPLDWLVKVYDGDNLVDLLFRPNHRPVTEQVLARAETVKVGACCVPVATATDVLVDKLLPLGPHRCDFTGLLAIARALREQLDWAHIRSETAHSPYAAAFLMLLEQLAVLTEDAETEE